MKAVRVVLTQNKANYKKEECVDNAMTYPLPPVSTVIGALHKACDYREYHQMDVSIQGKYVSIHKEFKMEKLQYNNFTDDRGTMIKKASSNISNAYVEVAKSLKRGSSFAKNEDIIIFDEEKYNEFFQLRKELENLIKEGKKLDANYKVLKESGQLDKEELKAARDEKNIAKQKIAEQKAGIEAQLELYATIEKQMRHKEVLNEVKLVLHIKASDDVMKDICNNILNMTAIGRAADFVNVWECGIVELLQDKHYIGIKNDMSAYLRAADIDCFIDEKEQAFRAGTRYSLNKNYEVIDNKKIFKKVSTLYRSNYKLHEYNENVFVDDAGEDLYIVNFL